MKAQLTMTSSLTGYQYRVEAERKTKAQVREWASSMKQYLETMHKPGEPKQFELCLLYPNGSIRSGSTIYL